MSEKFLPVQGYKGTRDFFPDEMRLRNWFFSRMREVAESFGYEEMGGPLLESFDVFAAKSGEEIVNEQIYNFYDKSNRRVAIRPEMTPTVARMLASRMEEVRFPIRWFSIADFMRYERPQKGRLREFWQLNMDILGVQDISSDLEMILLIVELMKAFGADESMFKVRVNHRGFFNDVISDLIGASGSEVGIISKAVDKRLKIPRNKYEDWLKESGLDSEKIALLDNVFALSFEDICKRLSVDSEGAKTLKELFGLIEECGLGEYCVFDFSIVRGFDYYTGTVFEVYDLDPENRRALFGGGRYDNLVGLFKKNEVSGIGFGLGDVTFENFLKAHNLIPKKIHKKDTVFVAIFDDVEVKNYLQVCGELRSAGLKVSLYLSKGDKLKKQLQYAEKMEYAVAVILGADELANNRIVIKDLLSREQSVLLRSEYTAKLKSMLGG